VKLDISCRCQENDNITFGTGVNSWLKMLVQNDICILLDVKLCLLTSTVCNCLEWWGFSGLSSLL